MPDPFKPTEWLDKIPTWVKGGLSLVAAIAGAILAFRDNWRLYTLSASLLIMAYVFLVSLYVFFSRRKLSSKKNQWTYRYGKYRPLGLIGAVLICLSFAGFIALEPSRQFAVEGIMGTRTPLPTETITPTSTSLPTLTPTSTSTPIPTPTLTPLPHLEAPDIVIAPFGSSDDKVELWIENDLKIQLAQRGLQNVIVRLQSSPVADDDQALALANKVEAKVVIWGLIDQNGVKANMLLSGDEGGGTVLPGTQAIRFLADQSPSEISTIITKVVPKNVTFLSLFAIGHLQYVTNNYAAGHQAFDAAMALLEENKEEIKFSNEAILHFFRARQMDREGKSVQEVVCEYAAAIKADPQFALAYNNLGIVTDRFFESGKKVYTTEESPPLPPEAVLCLESAGLSQAEFFEPAQFFRKAAEIDPNLTLAKYNEYAVMWRRNPTDDQIRLNLESIQKIDPSIIGTYVLLGVTDQEYNNNDAAIRMYQAGLENYQPKGDDDPLGILLHHNLGQLYLYSGNDDEKAEAEFLKIKEYNLDAKLALANLYYEQGRLEDASTELDEIINSIGTNTESTTLRINTFILRSALYFKEGQNDQMLALLNRVAQGEQTDGFANLLLGIMYQTTGQNEKSTASFSQSWSGTGTYATSQAYSAFRGRCTPSDLYENVPFENRPAVYLEWEMNSLPASDCLPVDPRERIDELYQLFHNALAPEMILPATGVLFTQCPYLYTQDPVSGEWVFQTTILYKLVDDEAAQLRPVSQFNGRLLVREQEPEISYLNRLYMLAKMSDGSFQVLEPDVDGLKRADSQYIVLHQGEKILVSFDASPLAGNVSQWWVMAVGYYTPLYTH